MFIQCKENKLLNKELSIDNSKSILNKKIVSNNKLIIFNYSKPTYIVFNIIFIVLGFMTLIKMSYICDRLDFNSSGLKLILLNFVSIFGVCLVDKKNTKIHYLFQFLFFYLILVILILSFIKKYSIDKRNLFSIILFCSILSFNLFTVFNNAYLLYHSDAADIKTIKENSQWYWYMIFLNIFK